MLICAHYSLPLSLRDGKTYMNIQRSFKLMVSAVLFSAIITTTSFASPNRNHNNNAINSATRGEVAKIQRQLKKIEKKRYTTPRASYVNFKSRNAKFSANHTNVLKVTATAYTSHVRQTDSTPNIAAWGDKLHPGMKAIAVSRDLLQVYGLKHRTKVRIKGLSGEYLVLDKMNKRWKKKIDIYMGKDLKKAYKWGRRKVELQWSL